MADGTDKAPNNTPPPPPPPPPQRGGRADSLPGEVLIWCMSDFFSQCSDPAWLSCAEVILNKLDNSLHLYCWIGC